MTKWLMIITMILSAGCPAWAFPNDRERSKEIEDAGSWKAFDEAMARVREKDRETGWSYVISGSLIAVGGVIGAQTSVDSSSKLIFGLSQSLGIIGIGYGVGKLTYGHEFNSFYESVKATPLTPEQRDSLVQRYLKEEKEKRDAIRKIALYTEIASAALNFYSASRESDQTTKRVLQFLGGVNVALAVAYTF